MYDILNIVLDKYEVFLFVFIRMTGFFVVTPIFSRKNIPSIYKVVFALFISTLIVNFITINMSLTNIEDIIVVVINEFCFGILLGFITYLYFTSLYIAGQIIDMQIGFGMVNVFDPQSNAQVPIIGNFYYIIALLFLFTINGHHILVKAIINSYDIVPIGYTICLTDLTTRFVGIFTQLFIIGFKVSSPILAAIFLSNVLLGILARTVPQMNVFVVGMPFKIFIGIITLIIIVPLYIFALQHIFEDMYEEIFNFMKVIAKG